MISTSEIERARSISRPRIASPAPRDHPGMSASTWVRQTAGVIGIGVDVVDVERFRTSLARTPSMRERLFTPIELAYVAPKADPVPSLAARFAAREAVMKAMGLGLGAFGFHDVWVEVLDERRADADGDRAGRRFWPTSGASRTWHLSLSHTGRWRSPSSAADR